MKTIVGRAVEVGVAIAAGAAGFGVGCEHPKTPTAKKIDKATSKRTRTVISRINDVTIHVTTAEIASPGESKSIHEGPFAEIFVAQNTSGETQIPMDDVQELSKLDALLSPAVRGAKGCVTALKRAAEPDSAYQSAVLRIRSGRIAQVGVRRSLL
jgi:hypothetical protein